MLAADDNHLDLDCGIACTRIASWLDDDLTLSYAEGSWTYTAQGQSCRIALEPLENRTLGHVSLERTHLTAQGDPDALAEFEKLFTLRFISAGG